MLVVSILTFIGGLACCIIGTVRLQRRSEKWDRENPAELFVTKTYQPTPSDGSNGSAFLLISGLGLLICSLIVFVIS